MTNRRIYRLIDIIIVGFDIISPVTGQLSLFINIAVVKGGYRRRQPGKDFWSKYLFIAEIAGGFYGCRHPAISDEVNEIPGCTYADQYIQTIRQRDHRCIDDG